MIVYNFRVLASILRDIFNFLPDRERKKGTGKERKLVKGPRFKAPHLPEEQKAELKIYFRNLVLVN